MYISILESLIYYIVYLERLWCAFWHEEGIIFVPSKAAIAVGSRARISSYKLAFVRSDCIS